MWKALIAAMVVGLVAACAGAHGGAQSLPAGGAEAGAVWAPNGASERTARTRVGRRKRRMVAGR